MMRAVIAAVLVFLVSGCAGTVSSMVREADKDPASSFDGTYTVTVDHPGGRQDMGPGWSSNCGPQKFVNTLKIASSEVSWRWSKDLVITGFVNSKGQFRLEQLLDNEVKGRGAMLSDGSVTVILQGDISEKTMKGLLVFGIAQFTNRGCSYPVAYSKN